MFLIRYITILGNRCFAMINNNPSRFFQITHDIVERLFKFISWCIAVGAMAALAKATLDGYAFFTLFVMIMAIIMVAVSYSIMLSRMLSLSIAGRGGNKVRIFAAALFFPLSISMGFAGEIFAEKIIGAVIKANDRCASSSQPSDSRH